MDFSKYHFKDLHPEEKIVRIVHRNWFYVFQQFFLVFVVIVMFFVTMAIGPAFFPEFLGNGSGILVRFMENSFMLVIWIYGFLVWIDYYFDVWVITSERIINIEQQGMFTRRVSELRFQKIQDVTTDVAGFLPTIFNFGDVRVQTAGEETEFVFRTVSDPYEIKNIIMNLQKQDEANARREAGERIWRN